MSLRDDLRGAAGKVASERYRKLVEDLAEDMGHAYGWKARAARTLGVGQSYMTKILANEVQFVGAKVIERAVEKFGLRDEYFTGAETPGHYSKYRSTRVPSATQTPTSATQTPTRISLDERDIHRAQYERLAREIADRTGGQRKGWQKRAAEVLDVTEGLISKMLAGRHVGDDCLARASDRLGVTMDYFGDPRAEPGDHITVDTLPTPAVTESTIDVTEATVEAGVDGHLSLEALAIQHLSKLSPKSLARVVAWGQSALADAEPRP